MAAPIIDNRLIYPESEPEIVECFNRLCALIDAGGGGLTGFHVVQFVAPVVPAAAYDVAPKWQPQLVADGNAALGCEYVGFNRFGDEESPIALVSGYFAAYDETEGFSEEWDIDDEVEDNMTLYVKYTESYPVMFQWETETEGDYQSRSFIARVEAGECPDTNTMDEVYQMIADAAPTGKVFDYWTDENGETVVPEETPVEASVVYTAVYKNGE